MSEIKEFLEENFPNDTNFVIINSCHGLKLFKMDVAVTEKGLVIYRHPRADKLMCLKKIKVTNKDRFKWCVKIYDIHNKGRNIPLAQLVAENFIEGFDPSKHKIYEGFHMRVVDKNKIKYLNK